MRRIELKKKLLVVGAAAIAVGALGIGTALAYWTSSATGAGQATAGQAATVTLSPGTVTSLLYPGGTADVATTAANPNPYAVIVSGLTAGTITSGSAGNACDTNGNGVSFNAPSSYPSTTYRVPAKATAFVIHISGGASMAISSDTTCQNQTFSIPLTGTATATN